MRCVRATGLVARFFAASKILGAGLMLSACAANQAQYDRPANVGAASERRLAVATPPKIEIEDDGLAVQSPPRARRRIEPDDPSEPFSPNYGPPPLPGEKLEHGPRKQQAVFHPRLRPQTRPISEAEAEAIVARAVVEHERRYP